MDKFLDTKQPRLNIKEIGNLNRPITIESVVKNLLTKKSFGPHGFTGKFYQTFKEELIVILLKLFQKDEEEHFLIHFMRPALLIPKPDKDTTRKENHRPILLMSTDTKILN